MIQNVYMLTYQTPNGFWLYLIQKQIKNSCEFIQFDLPQKIFKKWFSQIGNAVDCLKLLGKIISDLFLNFIVFYKLKFINS